MQTVSIPLSSLMVSEQWNSRVALDGEAEHKTAQSVEQLAALMKAQGQLSPIIVVSVPSKHPGKGDTTEHYRVIAGFRRVAAAKLLGWTSIAATIPSVENEIDARLINLSENLARKDLTSFEIARGVSALKEAGLTGDQIAERLGFSSRSYVNNLAKAYASCHPKVKEGWAKQEGYLTTDILNKLAVMTPDEQLAELDRLRGVKAGTSAGSGSGEGASEGDKEKPAKPHPRKYADLEAAYNACKGWKGDKAVKAALLGAFEFALCKSNAVKLIEFDLDAIKEAADTAKRLEKAAKMEEEAKNLRDGKVAPKGGKGKKSDKSDK